MRFFRINNNVRDDVNEVMSYIVKKILKLGNHFKEEIKVRSNDINDREQIEEYNGGVRR